MAWPGFRFKPNDIYSDLLDGTITGATDPIPVIDNTDAEDGPGLIAVENEIIKYTIKGSNEFSGLTRGYNGTAATGHGTGVKVSHPISAYLIEALTDAVEALYGGALDIVTTKGDLLVASAADTLARFGIGADTKILSVVTDTPGWIAQSAINPGGWIATGDSWAYASATTITVPSGAASKYSVGMKIKLTQTTVKYFYIVGVADTVLTVTGGSDYTVVDAAITLPFYSHTENPVGFPDWFAHTPVFTGFSTDPTGISSTFKISGKTCIYNFYASSAGTSDNAAFTITLPVTAITLTDYRINIAIAVLDNNVWLATAGLLRIMSAGTTAALGKTLAATGGFTASNSKTAAFTAIYRI